MDLLSNGYTLSNARLAKPGAIRAVAFCSNPAKNCIRVRGGKFSPDAQDGDATLLTQGAAVSVDLPG